MEHKRKLSPLDIRNMENGWGEEEEETEVYLKIEIIRKTFQIKGKGKFRCLSPTLSLSRSLPLRFQSL